MARVDHNTIVDFAWKCHAKEGESECGDRHVMVPLPGAVLVAAIDGLGHGPGAEAAADQAVDTIERHAETLSLVALMQRCHMELNKFRGVVMNIAKFDAGPATLSWLGVGDVQGRLLKRSSKSKYTTESLLTRPGVVGHPHQLPTLWVSVTTVQSGDILLMATDGIQWAFADKLNMDDPADKMADHIATHYRKVTDDALVVVARYL